jgi:protein TonB
LKEKVDALWTYPCITVPLSPGCNFQNAEVTVEAGVNQNGELAFVKITKSAGIKQYDENAINAVTTAAPFGPIPDGPKIKSYPFTVILHFIYRNRR